MSEPIITFYVVQNQEGKYFRAKGYGGSGDSWVDEIKKARIYGKIGYARRTVTFFSKYARTYGLPQIIALDVFTATAIDERERIATAKKKREISMKKADKQMARENLEQARKQFEAAQANLEKAQKGAI